MPDSRRVRGPDGIVHIFPADATDAEISAALGAIPQANAAQSPKAKTWADYATSALPVVGGIAGGVLGGPVGAALGAGGGEAWRQNINRLRGAEAPQSAGEAALGIGVDAAVSGAMAAAPAVAGKVIKATVGSPTVLRTAAKIVAPKGIRETASSALNQAANKIEAKAAQAAAKVAAPATSAPTPATIPFAQQAAKAKLTLTEYLEAEKMIKAGATKEKALESIYAQRELIKKFGLPSASARDAAVGARNASGVWGSK